MSDIRVCWFEIPTKDLNKAKAFYTEVLGRKMGEMPGPDGTPMHVFMGEDGANGALLAAEPDYQPGNTGPRVYLNCPDINAALGRVEAAGGSLVAEKTAIGPHGYIATFADLDGNWVSLHHTS